jgi:hypothetical protein
MASMAQEFCRGSRASEPESHAELGFEWRQGRRVSVPYLVFATNGSAELASVGPLKYCPPMTEFTSSFRRLRRLKHLGNQIGAASFAERQTVASAQVEAGETRTVL